MLVIAWPPSSLLTLPEQAQQQLEQVDKIEIERQRAHHGQLVRPLGSSIGQILALQALGVPSGEPRKHQHAGDREIGKAHVCTPVNNAHLVCRLLLEKNKIKTT